MCHRHIHGRETLNCMKQAKIKLYILLKLFKRNSSYRWMSQSELAILCHTVSLLPHFSQTEMKFQMIKSNGDKNIHIESYQK